MQEQAALLALAAALALPAIGPAQAEVCDKTIGDTGDLVGAPLWRYLLQFLLQPAVLVAVALVGLALLVPRLRGLALLVAVLSAAGGVLTATEILRSDPVYLAAVAEGCGTAYPLGLFGAAALAGVALWAFFVARGRARARAA